MNKKMKKKKKKKKKKKTYVKDLLVQAGPRRINDSDERLGVAQFPLQNVGQNIFRFSAEEFHVFDPVQRSVFPERKISVLSSGKRRRRGKKKKKKKREEEEEGIRRRGRRSN